MRSKKRAIRSQKTRKGALAVVGLGYVGLPLACLAVEKGYKVLGVVRSQKKAEMISAGVSPIDDVRVRKNLKKNPFLATTDFSVVKKAKAIIVCVPTPVDHAYNPDYGPVIDACKKIAKHLHKGQLIIIESTINPGTCEEVLLPVLETSGLHAGKDFTLAHCPERIDPGNAKWNVRTIPRVIGAYTKKGRAKAIRLYESIIDAPIRPMESLKAAEATKIMENSFRDINIAFVNEMAQSFSKLGIDILDVIEGAQTKPFAFLAHYPSCGVGGHCIPVDPYYLIERARQIGFDHKFLKLAREINNGMPEYTVKQLIEALNQVALPVKGTKVGILGVAYKANIDDVRESPSFRIQERLRELGAQVEVYDPHVPQKSTVESLEALLSKVDAVILVTNHQAFLDIPNKLWKKYHVKVLIDGKNALDKSALQKAGVHYRGIGR
ncbi:MAG: nucleotide sugar dehydrogenase [Candidatus Nomurabacteria bacterium]|nr:MAG: nucleotide sugar dehydrogenase [Candidatus Nomurabacteria bacterium]